MESLADDYRRVLAGPHGLPPRAYRDAQVFELERHAIFERSWTAVAREQDLEAPGQVVVASPPLGSVLLTRAADLELRAFHNVCRHRGSPLVTEVTAEPARRACVTCPYHGWTYELDGRLRTAPHLPAAADRADLALTPLQVASWEGFVLVAASSAPAWDAYAGVKPPWLRAARLARRARRVSYEVAANWKLCVENFQESAHFPHVHPALEALTPAARAESWIPSSGASSWLGGTMELEGATETVARGGRLDDRALLDPDVPRRVCDAMLFPTLLTSLQPDYLLTYQLTPAAPDLTRVVAEIHVHPTAVGTTSLVDVFELWDVINAEDRTACEGQQRNVTSPAFGAALYTDVEEGSLAFDRLVARACLEELAR